MQQTVVETFKKHFQQTIAKLEEKKHGNENVNLYLNEGDEADLAKGEEMSYLESKLVDRDSFYLKKLRQALHRIELGHFGVCEECGAGISVQRLKARPSAHLCIGCKEEQERQEGSRFKASSRRAVTSKTASNMITFPRNKQEHVNSTKQVFKELIVS